MPRPKKTAVKVAKKATRGKLSPAERSQVAKDRWAKRRQSEMDASEARIDAIINAPAVSVAEQDKPVEVSGVAPIDGVAFHKFPSEVIEAMDAPVAPIVEQEEKILTQRVGEKMVEQFQKIGDVLGDVLIDKLSSPAPQLAPVAPKKQKRAPQPKEFSGALKAAEKRLANAIVERAKASGQLAMLQAEIPSLIQIINALKGQQNIPAVPYDFNPAPVQPYQYAPTPTQFQQPVNDLGAIQAAMDAAQVAMPLSKARGGVQLTPDVVGTLEGPDDDDEDRFITGPGMNERGWIGG